MTNPMHFGSQFIHRGLVLVHQKTPGASLFHPVGASLRWMSCRICL